jgi:chitin synthase
VSWGTKGDNSVATDLGVVKSKKNENGEHTIEIAVPTEQKDLNEMYEEACLDLSKKVVEAPSHRDAKTKQEDYYKAFRTRLVICWIISNLALVAVICNAQLLHWFGDFQERSTVYLGFILWSVAVLALIRFSGSCMYLIMSKLNDIIYLAGIASMTRPLIYAFHRNFHWINVLLSGVLLAAF